jgi:hypothetical protein
LNFTGADLDVGSPLDARASAMGTEKLDGAEGPVEQHIRKVLARLSALKARLRVQEQTNQTTSEDSSQIDREDGNPSGINSAQRPI